MKNLFESSFSTANALWAALLIEELFRCGVESICICPGSRSTPLALAAAAHPGIQTPVHFDERGMAYYALGLAQANPYKLAAILVTSGTAVPNLFPATIEAFQSALPLLLLTADRPPELLDTGANQTIDQTKIFEGYLQWQATLPCPDLQIDPALLLTTVDQAVYKCLRNPRGPVQLNCMFREPFLADESRTYENYLRPIQPWALGKAPFTNYWKSPSNLQPEDHRRFFEEKLYKKKGIILAGTLQSIEACQAVLEFSKALNWPVFADITSQLRMTEGPQLIPYYDFMLFNPTVQTLLNEAESFLQFGVHLTSKRLLTFLATHPTQDRIVVAETPARHDPSHRVSLRIEANISLFCQNLLENLPPKENIIPGWWHPLKTISAQVARELQDYFAASASLSEPSIARILSESAPEGSQFFIGNSMPIRLMDMFATTHPFLMKTQANRGTSGIDGLIATAVGFATESQKPTTLLIGDISVLHDMNSLYLTREIKTPLVIVLLNNNGGGIFSLLPIFQQTAYFEKFFLNPHDLDFKQLAQFFDIAYQHPQTQEALKTIYRAALDAPRTTLIEVQTDFNETNHILDYFNKTLKQQDFTE